MFELCDSFSSAFSLSVCVGLSAIYLCISSIIIHIYEFGLFALHNHGDFYVNEP
jgi:hypothetical protein